MKKKNKKLKIYLSKSKQGNMDSLMKTRDLLSKYDIEILEFTGREYNTNKLDEADIVLILPHTLPKAFNYHFNLGKGQFTEYTRALDTNHQATYFIICLGDELYVSEIDKDDILEDDWKLNYVYVQCIENISALHIFEPLLQIKTAQSSLQITPMLACSNLKYKTIQTI